MPIKKVCPRCGATFDCSHNDISSCHCATINLGKSPCTYIQKHYSDCLYHDCLIEIKANFDHSESNLYCIKKKDDV